MRGMRIQHIWQLDSDRRMPHFLDRWEELAEHMGCRTIEEHHEMSQIADAVMGELIRVYRLHAPAPGEGGAT